MKAHMFGCAGGVGLVRARRAGVVAMFLLGAGISPVSAQDSGAMPGGIGPNGEARGAGAAIARGATDRTDSPSTATRAHNATVAGQVPFDDVRDFDFARRGFLATRADPLIRGADGHVVWDLSALDFVHGGVPATVNPSLWRHAQLLAIHGLFQVTDRIFQVRGFDISNITFVRGDRGWVVVDTLTTNETARAAYDLISERFGRLPITGIVYTHSHADHFGGTAGLIASGTDIPIVAPRGFLDAAVSENVLAGPAMSRRAAYQFGMPLDRDSSGSLGSGIGMGIPQGTQSLIPPNRTINATGEEVVIDGVRIRFQLTLGTEAPAEMNLAFPDWKVLDLAENANPSQHNILTPRGAAIRSAKAWADGLTEALDFFPGYDVLITSHGWPRFGEQEVADYIGRHRDAYAFLHDQTVRLMNQGLTGDEIAARLRLPSALEREWYNRPYYGSLSFNVRAVYQYYMGWYDANPVHLAPLPPEEGGRRYVEALGGDTRVLDLAREAYDRGDYTWSAELLNRLVFADPGNARARDLLARNYDQLAWQSENSVWRNIYRTGATELRDGVPRMPRANGVGVAAALPVGSLFDVLATRIDPEKAGDQHLRLAFVFPDRNAQVTVSLDNGVLTHRAGLSERAVDATLTVRYADFLAAFLGGVPLAPRIAAGEARIDGDAAAFGRLVSILDAPDPAFAIVTP